MELLTEFTIVTNPGKDSSALQSHYFRIKPELRYFIREKRKSAFRPYTGIQFSYIYRKWMDMNRGSYFEEKIYEDSAIAYNSAAIKSPVFTSSAQLGTLINIGRHFSFDLFWGLGIRIINTRYSQVENTVKQYRVPPKCKILITPDPAWWINGTVTRVHFNTGFRFIYYF